MASEVGSGDCRYSFANEVCKLSGQLNERRKYRSIGRLFKFARLLVVAEFGLEMAYLRMR